MNRCMVVLCWQKKKIDLRCFEKFLPIPDLEWKNWEFNWSCAFSGLGDSLWTTQGGRRVFRISTEASPLLRPIGAQHKSPPLTTRRSARCAQHFFWMIQNRHLLVSLHEKLSFSCRENPKESKSGFYAFLVLTVAGIYYNWTQKSGLIMRNSKNTRNRSRDYSITSCFILLYLSRRFKRSQH